MSYHQELFEFYDDNDELVSVGSSDDNQYLQEIAGKYFTAKDFRTWSGTVLAAYVLQELDQFDSDVQAKKNILRAIETVAQKS